MFYGGYYLRRKISLTLCYFIFLLLVCWKYRRSYPYLYCLLFILLFSRHSFHLLSLTISYIHLNFNWFFPLFISSPLLYLFFPPLLLLISFSRFFFFIHFLSLLLSRFPSFSFSVSSLPLLSLTFSTTQWRWFFESTRREGICLTSIGEGVDCCRFYWTSS